MTKSDNIQDMDAHLPAVIERNEQTVRRDFWTKLQRTFSHVPFAEKAIAAYYCALDPRTPVKVKGTLLAALAYFIMPVDVIPDVLAGLGFTDDMAVLVTAYTLVSSHITDEHLQKARKKLAELRSRL